jgi:hypothetical protein
MLLKKRDHGCWGRVLGFLLRPILVSARALGASGKQYCRKVCVCVCVCVRERERERERISSEIRIQQGKGELGDS